MAEQRARMRTGILPATRLTAAVRHVAPVVRRVLEFSAEAVVLAGNGFRDILARGTPPAVVGLRA